MSKISSSSFWQYSLGFFLIVASIIAIIVGWAIYNGIQNEPSNNVINITGEGKVYAKPDVAIIDLSVINQNADPKVVQLENDKNMQKVVDFLKQEGVDEKDIKTISYNLQPEYDYNWCKNTITSTMEYYGSCTPKLVDYILTQAVEVKIRDLNKVGEIIGGLTEAGANQISSINFVLDNDKNFKAEARKEAILDAQQKANEIAQTAGIKLGKIINVSESVNNVYPTSVNYVKQELMKTVSLDAPIQIGSNEVNVSVYLTYEIIK